MKTCRLSLTPMDPCKDRGVWGQRRARSLQRNRVIRICGTLARKTKEIVNNSRLELKTGEMDRPPDKSA